MKKPETVLVVVREEHLEAAIDAMNEGKARASFCVLAQACREVRPDFISCTARFVNFMEKTLVDGEAMRKLVHAFDERRYEDVKAMLPLTLELRAHSRE